MPFLSRRQLLCQGLMGATMWGIGCGTILHPERRGQPAGPLDWGIVALDALGLLLFFIPGVIAFAVDFNNGTIYLPPNYYGHTGPRRNQKLISVSVPSDQLTVQHVEKIVSKHTLKEIRLASGNCQTEELKSIDEFWHATDRLAAS